MLRKLVTAILFLLPVVWGEAQALQNFELTIKTDSITYISITEKNAWEGRAAIAHKQNLQLAVVPAGDAFGKQLEWYNLSGKDNKTPAAVNGTNTGIAAISFGSDQFEKCNTAADLKRMTSHITKNSFSHFSGIGQNGNITQHCFIVEMENGKRGLIYVTAVNAGTIKVLFKME